MDIKNIVNGPWEILCRGEWSGHSIEIFENPNKQTLTVIADGKGRVLMLNEYFVAEGNAEAVSENMIGYSLVISKNYPMSKGKFLCVSSGSKYAGDNDDSINRVLKEMQREMLGKLEKANQLSVRHNVKLVELKNKPGMAVMLFSEPHVMMSAMPLKKEETRRESPTSAESALGISSAGGVAQNSPESYRCAAIVSLDSKFLRKATRVMVENAFLLGMNSIIMDDEDAFGSMSSPNPAFQSDDYALRAMGMPMKSAKAEEVGININHFDYDTLRQFLRVPMSEDYLGKESVEMIANAIGKHRGEIRGLRDLERKIDEMADDARKFHAYRASRILALADYAYPKLLKEKLKLPLGQGGASIIRLDCKNVRQSIKQMVALSAMKTMDEAHKAAGDSEVKSVFFMPAGDKIVSKTIGGAISREITEMMALSKKGGIGFCVGISHEIDLPPEILNGLSMKMTHVSASDAAVREVNKKPYRVTVREALSS